MNDHSDTVKHNEDKKFVMKQSYKVDLQRSDMCRFLKNKTGKIIGSLLLVDLFCSVYLFFHHSCLGEFSFYEDQKAAKYEDVISQALTKRALPPFMDISFCSLNFTEAMSLHIIALFLVKFSILFLFLYQYRKLVPKWIERLGSWPKKTGKRLESIFSKYKKECKAQRQKIAALKNKVQAHKRLSQKYDAYQKKKLEKISDLSRILIHSFKAGHFLSNSEVLRLLKEIRETSFFLQENNFSTAQAETISVSDFITNIEKMLQWDLIKNNITLDVHYDTSQENSLTTDPFLLELMLLGFLKSILFYLYKGSKISLFLESKREQIQLKIQIRGHLVHDWYPLTNMSFDYGGFTLQGKKILSLLQVLNASVSSTSQEDFLVTISSLSDKKAFAHDNVVILKI